MTLNPSPAWAQCHVEVHEAPGWLDDCFRSGLWTKFRSAASEGFANTNDVAGDYATMSVTEGVAVNGCGWQRDISSLALGSSSYPSLRVRLRGRGTTPQYQIEVEMTDATVNASGWVDAPTVFEARTLNLTLGKTVRYVRLYTRSLTPSSSAQIDYDYAVVQAQPPLIPHEHGEVDVELLHTLGSSGFRVRCWHDALHGVTHRRYGFEEGSGVKAYDLSSRRGHGTLVNSPTWTTGCPGGGLQFTGSSSQRVDTGYTTTVPATGAVSISLRVKGSSGATGVLIGSGKAPGGVFNRLQLNFQSMDKIRVYVKDDAGNVRQYTSTRAVLDDSWHKVVAVISPANDVVKLYVDGFYDGGVSGTLGTITLDLYDFTVGCLHNESGYSSYATCVMDEVAIFGKELSDSGVKNLCETDPPSGISRAGCGSWVMIYLAAESESLVCKLLRGRILERATGGEPGAPWLELRGEDQSEVLHERTWSREFSSPTQVSSIVGYVIDDSADELYRDVDATNRTVTNNYRNENAWGVLGKLAEGASFASGEGGAHFFVDPGGCFRFRKHGSFACPHRVSDGGDGYPANVVGLEASERVKGSPSLVNDVRVVIFEEECIPRDRDGWTESSDSWTSPDPTDSGYPQSDPGDRVRGNASVKFQTTNPGALYRMRLGFGEADLSGFDAVSFSLKYGSGLSVDSFSFQMLKGTWGVTGDYYERTGIAPPGAAAWHEVTVVISDMARVGCPGKVVDGLEIRAVHATQVGSGGFLIDGLRFVRYEKSGQASDASSIASYGRRMLTIVDKGITDAGYASDTASNIVANRRHPVMDVRCTVPGRGQPGYRPAQNIVVTSLRDGLVESTFQVVRARHRYTVEGGYTCDLDLVAAKAAESPPSYSALVGASLPGLEAVLGEWRQEQRREAANSLRSVWV